MFIGKLSGILASGTISSGAVRENSSFTAQTLTVGNVASSDGFSDDLATAITTTGVGFTVSGSAGRDQRRDTEQFSASGELHGKHRFGGSCERDGGGVVYIDWADRDGAARILRLMWRPRLSM